MPLEVAAMRLEGATMPLEVAAMGLEVATMPLEVAAVRGGRRMQAA